MLVLITGYVRIVAQPNKRRYQMKVLMLVAVMGLVGCASANPVNFLWPTPKDSVTDRVLGEDAPKVSIVPWHTQADTIAEEDAIDAKIQVWIAEGELAKKNTAQVRSQNGGLTMGIYGLITMALAAAGWVAPSPSEKGKVKEALNTPAPNA